MHALLQPYMTLGYLAPFDLNDQTNVQIIGNRDKNKYHLHANLGLRPQKRLELAIFNIIFRR